MDYTIVLPVLCCTSFFFFFAVFLCDPILLKALATFHQTGTMGLSGRFKLHSSGCRCCLLGPSGARKPACRPYPVAKNACPGVGGLDLLDVGEVDLFGKDEEQQTLHSNRCDLKVQ